MLAVVGNEAWLLGGIVEIGEQVGEICGKDILFWKGSVVSMGKLHSASWPIGDNPRRHVDPGPRQDGRMGAHQGEYRRRGGVPEGCGSRGEQ